MRYHYPITQQDILNAVKFFRRVTRGQLATYFSGRIGGVRLKILEQTLPLLEREGKVMVERYQGDKVYSLARKNAPSDAGSPEHTLGCTDIYIRLRWSRMEESELVHERAFRGFSVVSDGGIRYSEKRGSMLAFEFHTAKNFTHGGVLTSKLLRYQKSLPKIEEYFDRRVTVLFVIAARRERVIEFIKRTKPILTKPVVDPVNTMYRYPFYFIDYLSFATIPIGRHLKTPLYLWGFDGNSWRLEKDD